MSKGARIGVTLAILAAALAAVGFFFMDILFKQPPQVDFTSAAMSGQPLAIHMQTVPNTGNGPHPTWVSYYIEEPNSTKWVQTSVLVVPAHTKIMMTIDQYDSGGPLRNQAIGLVTGVNDAAANGKPYKLINSYDNTLGVGHTFSMPSLGINVPMPGYTAGAACSPTEQNPAPCDPSNQHNSVTFSFTTPGAGSFPFQCFVPCGLSYFNGNGGPMATYGYMGGMMKVVA